MKNSSSQYSAAMMGLAGMVVACAGWIWVRQGFDPVVVVLAILAIATFTLSLRVKKLTTRDPRLGRLLAVSRELAAGKTDQRIVNIGDKDETGHICWHFNNMLDQLETCFREQKTVMRMAGSAKYFRRAQPMGLHGGFRSFLEGSNESVAMLEDNALKERERQQVNQRAQDEFALMINAAASGDFSQRMNEQDKEGVFLVLAQDLNKLLETTETSLDEVARVLRAVASGDLSNRVTADYVGIFEHLKGNTNATIGQLREIIGQVRNAVDAISIAAREIAAGNSDLSQRTEEQAASLEETAASMEELTSTVKQNAENAKHANQLALGASDVASKGGTVVSQVISTMDSINASSRKIVEIISVIDGIAFQTNILALNAAVEAARAGEQGRGFAVVASEVRNLAQRSAAAAKEIKNLIGDSVEKVETGGKLVTKAGQTMEEIVSSIKRVTDIMSEITAASAEQSTGIEQVNLAISQMDDVTQQNAALVEEAAAAAASMEEQSGGLSIVVSVFKV